MFWVRGLSKRSSEEGKKARMPEKRIQAELGQVVRLWLIDDWRNLPSREIRRDKDGREIKLIYGPTTEELWTIDREAFDVVVEYVEKEEEEENIVPPEGQPQSPA